jgi:hypothetical protein
MFKSITVGVLIVGGLLLVGCTQEAKTKADKAKQTAADAAKSTKDAADEMAAKALKEAQESADKAKQAAADAAKSAKDAADEMADKAGEALKETQESADKAKQAAADAAKSAKNAADEMAGKAGEALKGAQESVAASAAKAADALKGVAGGPELLSKVTEFFGSAGKTLQGITDVESAKAALPKLTELTASTDELSKSMASLPEGAKTAISGVVDKGIAELKAVVEKIMALPGVEGVLKPKIDELMKKLEAIAGKKS